ncbi:hypothetical protein B0T18DRAFT_49737 [Schizothecium vesticola]|uniref:Uncharacterized protein n=1 Tax=Schizothecium vesticola TaxID=314040 RepID=A0AA40FBY6_9PEZI|nr:hypothetical protein B0T18DRAFT_49737 [Schizothecium vesticola]
MSGLWEPILELLHEVQFLPSQHYSTASLRRHGRIYWANGTSSDHLMFQQLITMFFWPGQQGTIRTASPGIASRLPVRHTGLVREEAGGDILSGATAYDGREGCSTHGCVEPQLRIRLSRARRGRRRPLSTQLGNEIFRGTGLYMSRRGIETKAQGLEKKAESGSSVRHGPSPPPRAGAGGLYHNRRLSHMYRLGRDEQRACTAPRRRNGRGLVGIWRLAIRLSGRVV